MESLNLGRVYCSRIENYYSFVAFCWRLCYDSIFIVFPRLIHLCLGESPISIIYKIHGFLCYNSLFTHSIQTMLNSIHPPRPDWYEEFYASALDKTMKSYEAEVSASFESQLLRIVSWTSILNHAVCCKIAGYKSQLFANLRGKADKILEIGIGTGPNLKYYADDPGISVFGVDPNRKMEKYARAAAETAGLPPSNFRFMQSVCIHLICSNIANFF